MSLFWAAVDSDEPLDGPLRIRVADQTFERKAITTLVGMLGQVPQLEIAPEDALLDVMSDGTSMTVRFSDLETTIGLNGFATALEKFDRACSLRTRLSHTNDAGYLDHLKDSPSPYAIIDQNVWLLSESMDMDTGNSVARLSYGKPETDAIAFQALCSSPDSNPLITIVALVAIGDAPEEGESTELVVIQDDAELRLPGQISSGLNTYPGVLTTVDHRHALWELLQGQGSVSFRRAGGKSLSIPSSGTNSVVGRFLRRCSRYPNQT
ncbi:hypothetical protein IQ216_01985 [Cyanobium sp. LEGE 06143]|uniref:hypothetical protein n=1 Tax=Cyanobium sp. LEGE 06143 TaxID=945727 RepID=UPI0018812F2D|nr:hypothetical protein [Cyanobium sp. LEGE 06143]MBE9171894.1 hypothetical protein [Cyanobium sp. LEGE 06143]